MSNGDTGKGSMHVVAVAIPREVLDEYEFVVREAGFEPGAVIPSTLASLAGLDEENAATLVVNAGPQSVTTAIVENGVLLLHRSVDMSGNVQVGILAEATVVMPDAEEGTSRVPLLPLIDVDESQQEWAMQEAVDPYGRDFLSDEPIRDPLAAKIQAEAMAEVRASGQHRAAKAAAAREISGHVREVTQAISVATAYFEDTLATSPRVVLSAGSTSADELERMLVEADADESFNGGGRPGIESQITGVREMVDAGMLEAQAVSAQVPKGWLAAVRGALRS
jgi:type IV pilus assembly protein PilM